MNDTERDDWIMNDESLYLQWRVSYLSKRAFIREHRIDIDAHVNAILRPNRKPRML